MENFNLGEVGIVAAVFFVLGLGVCFFITRAEGKAKTATQNVISFMKFCMSIIVLEDLIIASVLTGVLLNIIVDFKFPGLQLSSLVSVIWIIISWMIANWGVTKFEEESRLSGSDKNMCFLLANITVIAISLKTIWDGGDKAFLQITWMAFSLLAGTFISSSFFWNPGKEDKGKKLIKKIIEPFEEASLKGSIGAILVAIVAFALMASDAMTEHVPYVALGVACGLVIALLVFIAVQKSSKKASK